MGALVIVIWYFMRERLRRCVLCYLLCVYIIFYIFIRLSHSSMYMHIYVSLSLIYFNQYSNLYNNSKYSNLYNNSKYSNLCNRRYLLAKIEKRRNRRQEEPLLGEGGNS